ncbi:hypothetical protein ID866_5897, partial [Astraeus odoratus]
MSLMNLSINSEYAVDSTVHFQSMVWQTHVDGFLVLKAELPPFSNTWSKCFIEISVDGSSSTVKTKSTKQAGRHEWDQTLEVPARRDGSTLRFELRRKGVVPVLPTQSVAHVEVHVSELIK